MRKIIWLIFLCCLIQGSSIANTNDSIAVTKSVDQLIAAMINGSSKELYSITSPNLSYGHSSGAVDNQLLFVEKISLGKSDFISIDITDQSVRIVGNTAIVRHKLSAVTNDQGKPGQVQLSILLVWQKHKNKWLLLARQAVKVAT